MLRAGDALVNKVTGELIIVREGREETGGRRFVVDMYVQPGRTTLEEHSHRTIEERITVVRGRIVVRIAGVSVVATEGMQVVLPAGEPHEWWNAGEDEAHLVVEAKPVDDFEQLLETLYGLANDGRTDSRGKPSVMQLAVLEDAYPGLIMFSKPAPARALIAPVARMMGYRRSYPWHHRTHQRLESKRRTGLVTKHV